MDNSWNGTLKFCDTFCAILALEILRNVFLILISDERPGGYSRLVRRYPIIDIKPMHRVPPGFCLRYGLQTEVTVDT